MTDILTDKKNGIMDNDIAVINKEYACHFEQGYYAVLIIRPYIQNDCEITAVHQLLLNKLQHMFDEKLQDITFERVSAIWQKSVVCMVNIKENSNDIIVKRMNRMKLDILRLNDIFDKINIVIGISKTANSLDKITNAVKEAQTAILDRVRKPNQYVITTEECEEITVLDEKIIFDANFRTDFLGYFERLDIDKIEKGIKNIEIALLQGQADGKKIFNCYNELAATICFGAKNYLQNYQFPDVPYFVEVYHDMLSMEDIFTWLTEFVKKELEQYIQDKKELDSKPIRQAKQYIYDRYNQSISLEDVSTVIGFNPAYFSTLFKKETGKNFMEYIIEIRIQNAKQFLTQTNLDIMEIASQVGYSDLKYFSKIFKKVTGINPSEYRRLYG